MLTDSLSLSWPSARTVNITYSVDDSSKVIPPTPLGSLFQDRVHLDNPFGLIISTEESEIVARLFDPVNISTAFQTIAEANRLKTLNPQDLYLAVQNHMHIFQRTLFPSVLGSDFKGVLGVYVVSRAVFADGAIRYFPRTGLIKRGSTMSITEMFAYGDTESNAPPYSQSIGNGTTAPYIRNIILEPGLIDFDRTAFVSRPTKHGIQVIAPSVQQLLSQPPGDEAANHAALAAAIEKRYKLAKVHALVTTSVVSS